MNAELDNIRPLRHSQLPRPTVQSSFASFTVLQFVFLLFPARRYASAGNSDRNVSVRLSICLSRAGIVSKRRKLALSLIHI